MMCMLVRLPPPTTRVSQCSVNVVGFDANCFGIVPYNGFYEIIQSGGVGGAPFIWTEYALATTTASLSIGNAQFISATTSLPVANVNQDFVNGVYLFFGLTWFMVYLFRKK